MAFETQIKKYFQVKAELEATQEILNNYLAPYLELYTMDADSELVSALFELSQNKEDQLRLKEKTELYKTVRNCVESLIIKFVRMKSGNYYANLVKAGLYAQELSTRDEVLNESIDMLLTQ